MSGKARTYYCTAGAMVVSIPKDAANEKEADAAAATAIADSVKGSPGASKIKVRKIPQESIASHEPAARIQTCRTRCSGLVRKS